MSNISLHIGGRDYTVACANGEEAHVTELGQLIDEKVQSIGAGATNEVRQLLFAALLLADELSEARRTGGGLPASTPAPAPSQPSIDTDRLDAIAARLESCASALEG
jgi:cell division protein ZapA